MVHGVFHMSIQCYASCYTIYIFTFIVGGTREHAYPFYIAINPVNHDSPEPSKTFGCLSLPTHTHSALQLKVHEHPFSFDRSTIKCGHRIKKKKLVSHLCINMNPIHLSMSLTCGQNYKKARRGEEGKGAMNYWRNSKKIICRVKKALEDLSR